jgi:hypothetical protein
MPSITPVNRLDELVSAVEGSGLVMVCGPIGTGKGFVAEEIIEVAGQSLKLEDGRIDRKPCRREPKRLRQYSYYERLVDQIRMKGPEGGTVSCISLA